MQNKKEEINYELKKLIRIKDKTTLEKKNLEDFILWQLKNIQSISTLYEAEKESLNSLKDIVEKATKNIDIHKNSNVTNNSISLENNF